MRLNTVASMLVSAGLIAAPALALADGGQSSQAAAQTSKNWNLVNQNSAKSTGTHTNWPDWIKVSGLANMDGRLSGDSFDTNIPRVRDTSSDDLYINNVNLFVDANLDEMVSGHMNLSYGADVNRADKRGTVPGTSSLDVAEAYATIGDFDRWPYYARVGKMNTPFGSYDPYALIMPLTQALEQLRATTAEVGFVLENGVYGSVYAFNGAEGQMGATSGTNVTRNSRVNNGGVTLGYNGSYQEVTYGLKGDGIENIRDVDSIAGQANPDRSRGVSGMALHGQAGFRDFDGSFDVVNAARSLSATERNNNKLEPGAFSGRVGYNFEAWQRPSNVGVDYQSAWGGDRVLSNAFGTFNTGPSAASTPGILFGGVRERYGADYTYEFTHHLNGTVALYNDTLFNDLAGGTAGSPYLNGSHSWNGAVRLSANF